jgi:O-antigen ligase
LGTNEGYWINTLKIRNPQAWIIPVLITLGCFNGLVKAITGIRYFPLLIDLSIIFLLIARIFTQMLNQKLRLGREDFVAIAFIALAFLGMFHPNIPSFQAGLEGFRKFAFMIFGFLVGRHLISITGLKRLIRLLLISAFVISLYGIKQYLFPSALDYRLIELSTASPITYLMGGHIRAFSTLAGPFHLGLYLVAILLLLTSIWLFYPGKRLLVVLLGIPMLLALVMTVTKSNWFGLLVGIFFVILLNSKNFWRTFGQIILIGVICLVILFVLLQLSTVNPIFKTINDGLQAFQNPTEAPTMVFRIELWRGTIIPLIRDSPWIGYGTGSAGEGLGFLFNPDVSVFTIAHNLFLKVQFEMGLIGTFTFFILIISIFFHMLKVRRSLKDSFLLLLSNWSLAFFVSMMVAGLTGSILDAYPVNLLFWILMGSATRLCYLERVNVGKSNKAVSGSVKVETAQ